MANARSYRSRLLYQLIQLGALAALATLLCAPAQAQYEKSVRVSGFVDLGSVCEATFTINPALPPTITNVNIKIGGALPTVDDPSYWYINSPTVTMTNNPGTTGVYVELYENGVPVKGYHESNTSIHNGVVSTGTWTVGLYQQTNACADYDDHVRITFSLL